MSDDVSAVPMLNDDIFKMIADRLSSNHWHKTLLNLVLTNKDMKDLLWDFLFHRISSSWTRNFTAFLENANSIREFDVYDLNSNQPGYFFHVLQVMSRAQTLRVLRIDVLEPFVYQALLAAAHASPNLTRLLINTTRSQWQLDETAFNVADEVFDVPLPPNLTSLRLTSTVVSSGIEDILDEYLVQNDHFEALELIHEEGYPENYLPVVNSQEDTLKRVVTHLDMHASALHFARHGASAFVKLHTIRLLFGKTRPDPDIHSALQDLSQFPALRHLFTWNSYALDLPLAQLLPLVLDHLPHLETVKFWRAEPGGLPIEPAQLKTLKDKVATFKNLRRITIQFAGPSDIDSVFWKDIPKVVLL